MGGRDPISPNYSSPFSYAFLFSNVFLKYIEAAEENYFAVFSPASGTRLLLCPCESPLQVNRSHGDVCVQTDTLPPPPCTHTSWRGEKPHLPDIPHAIRKIPRGEIREKQMTLCLFIKGDDISLAVSKRCVVAFTVVWVN